MSNGAGQRRRLACAWSRVLLATMACVQAAPAVAQEPTEDVPCLLTNGMAQLHTEDSPASCADGCSGLRKSTLTFAGSSASAFVLEQALDGEVLRIRCSHGFVSVSQPKGESLRVTPGTGVPPGKARLSQPDRDRIRSLWDARKTLGGRAREVSALWFLVLQLQEVVDLAEEARLLGLLQARQELTQGHLEAARTLLIQDSLAEPGLARDIHRERQELLAEWRARNDASRPWEIKERISAPVPAFGNRRGPSEVAPAPGARVFWQDGGLCLSDGETMRCWSLQSRQWSAPRPYRAPAGIEATKLRLAPGNQCAPDWVYEVPALGKRSSESPADECGDLRAGELVAVVPGAGNGHVRALLLRRGSLRVRTKKGTTAISLEDASQLLLESNGSALAGGARFAVTAGGTPTLGAVSAFEVLLAPLNDSTHPWVLAVEENAPDWVLVSPDQAWLAFGEAAGDHDEQVIFARLGPK